MTKKKFEPEFMYVGQKLDVYRNGKKIKTVEINSIDENTLFLDDAADIHKDDMLIANEIQASLWMQSPEDLNLLKKLKK